MTVPEQTAERRWCLTHSGETLAASQCVRGMQAARVLEIHRPCVPAVLVRVSQREAEQKVIAYVAERHQPTDKPRDSSEFTEPARGPVHIGEFTHEDLERMTGDGTPHAVVDWIASKLPEHVEDPKYGGCASECHTEVEAVVCRTCWGGLNEDGEWRGYLWPCPTGELLAALAVQGDTDTTTEGN